MDNVRNTRTRSQLAAASANDGASAGSFDASPGPTSQEAGTEAAISPAITGAIEGAIQRSQQAMMEQFRALLSLRSPCKRPTATSLRALPAPPARAPLRSRTRTGPQTCLLAGATFKLQVREGLVAVGLLHGDRRGEQCSELFHHGSLDRPLDGVGDSRGDNSFSSGLLARRAGRGDDRAGRGIKRPRGRHRWRKLLRAASVYGYFERCP